MTQENHSRAQVKLVVALPTGELLLASAVAATQIANYMWLPCPQANYCSGSAVAAARLYGGGPASPRQLTCGTTYAINSPVARHISMHILTWRSLYSPSATARHYFVPKCKFIQLKMFNQTLHHLDNSIISQLSFKRITLLNSTLQPSAPHHTYL